MGIFESSFYRSLSTLADFVFLNVLWLLACVPVITAFPATAAMFGVIKDWTKEKHTGIFGAFVCHFRENFKQSAAISVPWFLFGSALVADYAILLTTDNGGVLRIALISLLSFGTLVYVATSVFLFPVMVGYDVGWRSLVWNSLLFGLGKPLTSVSCAAVVLIAAGTISFVPVSILVLGSVASHVVFRLCDRTFGQVEGRSSRKNV